MTDLKNSAVTSFTLQIPVHLCQRSQYSRMGITVDTDTRRIAKQRIRILFELAHKTLHENPDLAQRYVDTARRIAMAAKICLPAEYKRQICKHCKSFILPGVNCKVRLQQRREPHVVITCLKCGGHTRIPTARRQEKKIT